jgi:hypothetical protein
MRGIRAGAGYLNLFHDEVGSGTSDKRLIVTSI